MDDMILKVKCPNDSKQCTVAGGEIMESMVLLGDEEYAVLGLWLCF